MNTYTVSELCTEIKNILTREYPKEITVTGEISNIKLSGKHTYLTLKDDTSMANVMFWSTHLTNSNGENVEISGKINYYSKTNNINLIGRTIKNLGIGMLNKMYEELRLKYEALGYFNHKQTLPSNIVNVGIVTSFDGAALQDILYVLRNKHFCGNVYVYDCNVQGSLCAASVERGIKFFNENNEMADLILITRGGGSFEDLMGFSDPKVIEAIHKSSIYTISAVGHEIDTMLSDCVANYRAPTPSIAAELIAQTANKTDKLDNISKDSAITKQNLLMKLRSYKESLLNVARSVENQQTVFDAQLNEVVQTTKTMSDMLLSKLYQYKTQLQSIGNMITNLDHTKLLEQGFVLFMTPDKQVILSIDEILNKNISMMHSSGLYNVVVQRTE